MFTSYTDSALMAYNTAVTRLWLAGDESYRNDVQASGAEMTVRGIW